MVCIYCQSPTRVTNSRHQRRSFSIWRRRSCPTCRSIFTTLEQADLSTGFMVKGAANLRPFNKDALLVSIYESCKHRPNAIADASALTRHIIPRIMTKQQDGVVQLTDIHNTVLQALKHFDRTAAAVYQAYHPIA